MARNSVQIIGDESNMLVHGINLTGPDPLLFESGSFSGSPEEHRVANLILTTGIKVFRLKVKWGDPKFNRTTITGKLRARGNL